MPPKKPVKEEKILLGRPGNNLKSGIVWKIPCSIHRERALSFVAGGIGKCWKINAIPSHHKMLSG
jgi:hypothetical protein